LRNRTWFEVIAAGLVTMVVLLALYTALRAWLADIEHRRVEGRLNTTRGILVAVFWFLVGIAPLAAVCCLPFLVFDGSARYVLLLVADTELCLVLAVTFFALFRGPGHAGFRRLPYSWRGLLGLFAAMPVAFVVTPLRSAEPLGLALDSAYGVAVLLALTASLPLAALAAAMLWAAIKAAPSADDSPPEELIRVLTEEVAAKHGTPATTRSVQAAHVAAIASIPGISEIAEAVKPPFYKSFLKVSIANEARTITFDAFGVRGDEDLQKSPDGVDRIDHLVLKLEDPVGLEDGAALPEVVVDSIEPVMFGIGDFPGS
jgi:hypothetical protein